MASLHRSALQPAQADSKATSAEGTARDPTPCPRNYLLRVLGGAGGPRYLVQDLRTGERQQFASEEELHRFLASRVEPKRLR